MRRQISESNGIYFITFTCARWLPLFQVTNGHQLVYDWFNYLTANGNYIVGYVIMPEHAHTIIAFRQSSKSINTIIGNGKRFMAYGLVDLLKQINSKDTLLQLSSWVNDTDKKRKKQHEVFEPSFDKKECYTTDFILQKLDYIHLNPCRYKIPLADKPEDYLHSSAKYYLTGEQGIYTVTHYAALQDIDLTAPL
ncbi:hypothetical protein FRZ67_11505 [Panacibacter ginsenosidivorans]|uniref:Transposase IS200-like domain-containing protein n=1 Tax=Panacibacter ginsenosidivorans TaxID=1813871 RepID=A0A5B8V902_9BACT|nr:hypothetical protein [Panacibacter ginsenosidivorans]QEC67894.1 hypothetical protein FRZ67_11505 [Panacibacter ginsenosidivorans]